ncbi:Sodium/hydrogen exchanger family-domain-containing protein [Dipodascopsis uninucleata]
MGRVTDYLPYEEPTVSTVLIQGSFILLLVVVNKIFDDIIHCGLVGQIFVGIFWGMPLGNFLEVYFQKAIMNLGYLGLILLVYEGGLNVSLAGMQTNMAISFMIAFTGVFCPMGLSFLLRFLCNASWLQCFAAGSALSSTSLGTTFSILASANFSKCKLGSVITTAAVIDDVLGLVFLEIVSTIGNNQGSLNPSVIARPIGACFALLVLAVVFCLFIAKPFQRLAIYQGAWKIWEHFCLKSNGLIKLESGSFVMQNLFLLGVLAVAGYSGTSILYAAFLAGLIVTWWNNSVSESTDLPLYSGSSLFKKYFSPVLNAILTPFFFGSLGFSIPLKSMFEGTILWKGFVYFILMTLAKMFTGLWLLDPGLSEFLENPKKSFLIWFTKWYCAFRILAGSPNMLIQRARDTVEMGRYLSYSGASDLRNNSKALSNAAIIYPSLLLSTAMVARGEIGLLVASVAMSSGIFDNNEDIFLIVIWSILLCTIVAPICVGYLIARIKKGSIEVVEMESSTTPQDEFSSRSEWQILGIWGRSE